jgi:hypothetical protein
MRSYFKAYQTFKTVFGAGVNAGNSIVVPSYNDFGDGEEVYVQFGFGLKQFHLEMVNAVWDASADFAVNPPGFSTSGTCNLCNVVATGGMQSDPAHILDFVLVRPYNQHPLD